VKYFKKITGKSVYLSPMNTEDAEIYVKWLSDLSIAENLGNAVKTISVTGEKEWIEKNSHLCQYAIVKLETDELIGNCGFNDLNHIKQCGEVGLFIGDEENRNKGYGTEALKLLVSFGFDYLNLNNIMLKVFEFNERAIKCYKKVGFKEFGRRRQSYYLKGKYYDEIYMDIIRAERPSV
jgi:RimJ/RimL family protein N-acetyltransferase